MLVFGERGKLKNLVIDIISPRTMWYHIEGKIHRVQMHGCEKKKSVAENTTRVIIDSINSDTTNSYILQGINFVVSLFIFKISIYQ